MQQSVTERRDGSIAVLTVDNPPVNALSFHVRQGLFDALGRLKDDPEVAGVVITCAGRTFIAGADIREFSKPIEPPALPDLIERIESFRKPVLAAMHGNALGGGLELALACHFRLADRDLRLGLPEVKLGILPGAGGTQRLPRLIGAEAALDMILSGEPVPAPRALEIGLIDAIAEGALVDAAISFLRAAIAEGRPLQLVRDRDDVLARSDRAAFEQAAEQALKRARGLEAPAACVESVRNALTLPIDEGLKAERALLMRLLASDQSRAMRHLFFAERAATRVAGVTRDHLPRPIERVGIVGAGTMGTGISLAVLAAGLEVVLLDVGDEPLRRAVDRIGDTLARSVARGSLDDAEAERRKARLSTTTRYDDFSACDLLIEAALEDIAVKQGVFERLDAVARPGAVLATNTSYLDVDRIASFTRRPEDVLGLHFFSPANVMKLLEIVRGRQTAPEVLATALAFARRIGKVPVVAGVCHGFIGNRMLEARSSEDEQLLLEGASPRQVDDAFAAFGWPMGPFEMNDMAGIDIGWHNRRALGLRAEIADSLCEAGRFGQKTGRGFYRYEPGSRRGLPDPEVEELIAAKARERGIARRQISDEEIIERTHLPLINEGARILAEGIAARGSDIDVVWTRGYGFPVARGGPMFWADTLSLRHVVERLRHWHAVTGKAVFDPAPLLVELAESGASLADWQAPA